MQRRWIVGIAILAVIAALAIGIGAYNFGVSEGLEQTGRATEVVREVRPGYGFGFFPFGFLLFPLFFIGVFALFRALFWRRWDGPWGPGPDRHGSFEEWHRRQHEGRDDRPESSSERAGT